MAPRDHDDWEELARREPWFAVLTDKQFLRENLDEDARRRFFESGEADVDRLFDAVHQQHVGAALDFGCGVGRLTLALARRASSATGCDTSSNMIAAATQNALDAGLANTRFVTSLDDLRGQTFDFISSLIVFQHIPVSEGLETLSTLLQMLRPGGFAALHFTLRRPGGWLRRRARAIRAAVPALHRLILRIQRDPLHLPYMQMNEYDEREIRRRMRALTGDEPIVIPRTDGDVEGAVFIARRSR